MTDAATEGHERALAWLKTIHTAIWLLVESAMAYLIVAGIRGRTDRRAGVAAAIVATESVVFLSDGGHCPLTALATRLGAESGSVTDIYLPGWLAHNLPRNPRPTGVVRRLSAHREPGLPGTTRNPPIGFIR